MVRVLGCLSRPDCVKVKFAYNRLGFKRTLDEAFRTVLKSQANYMTACLMLISEDVSLTPLGTDKELLEEEAEVAREAERLVEAEISSQYDRVRMAEKGEGIMQSRRKLNKKKRRLFSPVSNKDNNVNGAEDNKAAEEEANNSSNNNNNTVAEEDEDDTDAGPVDPLIAEEDRILSFTWDGKGRFMDATKLTANYRELEYCENQVSLYLDRLEDEISALKGVYRTILKHRVETDAYLRVYQNHIRCLTEFQSNRDILMSNNKSKKY